MMTVTVTEKAPFKMIGYEKICDMTHQRHLTLIPEFWEEISTNGKLARLMSMQQLHQVKERSPVNAVMGYENVGAHAMAYLVGVVDFDNRLEVPDDLKMVEIPACKWAIMRSKPYSARHSFEQVQKLWQEAGKWFETATLQRINGPELEFYYTGEVENHHIVEVWIPVTD